MRELLLAQHPIMKVTTAVLLFACVLTSALSFLLATKAIDETLATSLFTLMAGYFFGKMSDGDKKP